MGQSIVMKTWLRILIVGIEASIVFAAVYFEPTHSVRGRLWGETFYDHRPVSYWSERIEAWIGRFDSLEDCESFLVPCNVAARKTDAEDSEQIAVALSSQYCALFGKVTTPRPPGLIERFMIFADGRRDDAPRVLIGDPDAVPVLLQLAQNERHRSLANQAIWRADQVRKLQASAEKEGFTVFIFYP